MIIKPIITALIKAGCNYALNHLMTKDEKSLNTNANTDTDVRNNSDSEIQSNAKDETEVFVK
jgi:hypothetical protein